MKFQEVFGITEELCKVGIDSLLKVYNDFTPVITPLFKIYMGLQEIKTRRIQLEAEIKRLTIISNEVLSQIRTIIGTRTEERKRLLDALIAAFNKFVDRCEANMIIQIGYLILNCLDKPIITEEEVSALVDNLMKSGKSINVYGDYNDETTYI